MTESEYAQWICSVIARWPKVEGLFDPGDAAGQMKLQVIAERKLLWRRSMKDVTLAEGLAAIAQITPAAYEINEIHKLTRGWISEYRAARNNAKEVHERRASMAAAKEGVAQDTVNAGVMGIAYRYLLRCLDEAKEIKGERLTKAEYDEIWNSPEVQKLVDDIG